MPSHEPSGESTRECETSPVYRRPCTVARVPSSGSPEGPHARVRGPKRIGLRGGYTRRVTRNHLVCAFGFGAPRRPGAVRVMVACGGCGRHASGVGHLSDVGHKHVSHWHGLCKHCHWTRLETRVDAGPGARAAGAGRPGAAIGRYQYKTPNRSRSPHTPHPVSPIR